MATGSRSEENREPPVASHERKASVATRLQTSAGSSRQQWYRPAGGASCSLLYTAGPAACLDLLAPRGAGQPRLDRIGRIVRLGSHGHGHQMPLETKADCL